MVVRQNGPRCSDLGEIGRDDAKTRFARRDILVGALLAGVPTIAMGAPPSLDQLASSVAGPGQTSREKVRRVVQWTHDKLEWTATDYKDRSVDEIIRRGGGNCNEQAVVVVDFLNRLGVKCRRTREVNVQPASEQREKDSEEMIAKQGPRASVFGRRFNDHVWIEYFDTESGEWTPSDPTLNIVGFEPWIKARLGFGTRPVHDIVPYADMLFPITVLAMTSPSTFESRSHRYLIEGFSTYVPGAACSPDWPNWERLITVADDHLMKAFQGQYNFHQDGRLIDGLIAAYGAMKAGGGKCS